MASVNDKAAPATAPVRFECEACGKKLRVAGAFAGKKIKCPLCTQPTPVPTPEPEVAAEAVPTSSSSSRALVMPIIAVFGVMVVTIGCSVYANLSFAVTNQKNFEYFPPFKAYVNGNSNRHLGAEYLNIAKSIVAGEGFSSPFKEKTGPTAWMPPVLPTILAGLLWACDNDIDAVMTVCLFLHVTVLVFTGFLVLAIAWQTTERIGVLVAAAFFLVCLISDFRIWFQNTHDMSIVLLALDVVLAGLAWCKPLQGWKTAIGWGIVGGMCALISPVVGMTWGALTIAVMIRERAWRTFGIAILLAMVTVSPWMVRNYLVFGKFIPIKSNAAYEFWQSQCIQKDGLLHHFDGHPYGSAGRERREYKAIGEIAFIEKRRDLFWQSVQADPLDFADRVAARLLGATLWYEPFNLSDKVQRPNTVWTSRVLHPLPFLALVFLAMTAFWKPLHAIQWLTMGMYVLYIGPYIAVSYYERYAVPLLAVKALLVIWGADRVLSMLIWAIKQAWSLVVPSRGSPAPTNAEG